MLLNSKRTYQGPIKGQPEFERGERRNGGSRVSGGGPELNDEEATGEVVELTHLYVSV